MCNEERYRQALETIARDAKRCDYCARETPEGIAPLATHLHGIDRPTDGACDEHRSLLSSEAAKRKQYAIFSPFKQPAHVTVALAALETP